MTSKSRSNLLPFLAVLMAGGGGTRLWPMSQSDEPKQCLPLLGGRTLLESTVERLLDFIPAEHIFVVSNQELADLFQNIVKGIPEENYFCEPAPRNTAPAIAFALARLRKRHPQYVMACLPADHYIGRLDMFQGLVRAAGSLAEKGFLVALGIEPTGPVTGYGYIEQGEPLDDVPGIRAFRVRRFTEKPDAKKAREMIRRGGYTWNSGMFFWRSDVIEAEFVRFQPDIARVISPLAEAFEGGVHNSEIEAIWNPVPSVSLDYGILEKSDAVAVLPAHGLEWSDIGSWDALVDLYRTHPELQSAENGVHVDVGSTSVTVLRKTSSPGRILATIGLRDMIIVETDEALLICRKGSSQDVRTVVEQLNRRK
jgi:mannose-1-phosphate guanylyltransferase